MGEGNVPNVSGVDSTVAYDSVTDNERLAGFGMYIVSQDDYALDEVSEQMGNLVGDDAYSDGLATLLTKFPDINDRQRRTAQA